MSGQIKEKKKSFEGNNRRLSGSLKPKNDPNVSLPAV